MYLYLFKVIKRGNRLRLHDAKIIIGFCRLVEISWQNKVSIFKSKFVHICKRSCSARWFWVTDNFEETVVHDGLQYLVHYVVPNELLLQPS